MRLHERAPFFSDLWIDCKPCHQISAVRARGNSFEPVDLGDDDGHTPASDLFASDTLGCRRRNAKADRYWSSEVCVLIEDTEKSPLCLVN